MEQPSKTKRILRRVWYGIAITLSVLVLVISSAGVIGTWIIEQNLVQLTQNLLNATIKTAGGLRQVVAQIDQESAELRQISSAVSAVSIKLSQNIEDKGLVATLLPAEQEQKLNEQVVQIQETLATVREILSAGISMYQSINRLPFVSLPGLSEEKVAEITQAVADLQTAIEDLQQGVTDFRTGVSEGVGQITQIADRVTQGLDNLRAKLTELDQGLAALQDLARQLNEIVPLAFGLAAVLLTIFMAYVAYTQVEIIRLLVGRWKALRPATVTSAPVIPFPAAVDESVTSEPEQSAMAAGENPTSEPEQSVIAAGEDLTSEMENPSAPEPPAPQPAETEVADPDQDLL